jgi:hypothetical protein
MLLLPDGSLFVGSFVNDLIDGPGRYYSGGYAIEKVRGCGWFVRGGGVWGGGGVWF